MNQVKFYLKATINPKKNIIKFFLIFILVANYQYKVFAQNVGIGTTTPTSKLHVLNTAATSTGLIQNTNTSNSNSILDVKSSGIGSGVVVNLSNASNGARGVDVVQAGVGPGVFATSAGGNAVWGITSSISAAGVIGDNTFGEAVVGRNRGGNGVGAVVGRNDSSGYGVRGFNTKDGIGVLGQSGISGGTGVAGRFENVNAANTSSAVNVATNGIGSGITIQLSNASNGARGVDVLQSGVGPGVFATSAGGNAVWGITSSISAAGVIGDNTFGEAVVGRNRGGNGVGAVVGRNDSSGYGVRGFNTKDGIGVLGQAGISGGTGTAGRFDNVNASNPTTVLAVNNASGASGYTILAIQGGTFNAAIKGSCSGLNGNGIIGEAYNGSSAYGIWGTAAGGGYAGYFSGNVYVGGTLSKAAGTFKIDHPQDPANKYLIHSFVESPDMMNIYNGNIVTDANGNATVLLPSYFEAENIEFRYQLTVMNESEFAQARVGKKISNNQFVIKTDKPNIEVSWMVTGVRNDAYAQQHRVIAEVEKSAEDKGKYLNPIENGQPINLGINYERMKKSGLIHDGTETTTLSVNSSIPLQSDNATSTNSTSNSSVISTSNKSNSTTTPSNLPSNQVMPKVDKIIGGNIDLMIQ